MAYSRWLPSKAILILPSPTLSEREPGLVLAMIGLPSVNGLTQIEAIVQEIIEGSPRECRPAGSFSRYVGRSFALDLLSFQVLFELH